MNFVKKCILLCSLLFVNCADPFRTQFDEVEDAVLYRASALHPIPAIPDTLKVMTWNIRYGSARILLFYEGWGDRCNMTKSEIESNLDQIEKKIKEVNPDILFLQEVDVDSKRTAYIDQLQHILDNTNLNYAYYASIWKSDFVPSDGIGRINMGNAIVSKYPLSNGTRIALPMSSNQSALEKYFWFHRNILKARITVSQGKTLHLLTMHDDAWTTDGTKKKQIETFKEELDALSQNGDIFVAGGDFNELPPGSPQWKDFNDLGPKHRFRVDDYTGEENYMVDLLAAYNSAIPLAVFQSNPSQYFSFTGDASAFWNRTLDYIFTNTSFRINSGMALQDSLLPDGSTGIPTMPLSDHAPIFGLLEVQ